ncbi:MAG: FIST N-terminal domain-containing protein [Pirellula sp.]
MFVSSGIATHPESIDVALRKAYHSAAENAAGDIACAFVFVSGLISDRQRESVENALRDLTPGVPVFGCSAESVIGSRQELEWQSAASVLLVSGVAPFRIFPLECLRTPDGTAVIGYDEDILQAARQCNGMAVVACPKSFSIDLFIDALTLDCDESQVPVIGGYSSSQDWNQANMLFCGDQVLGSGAVGLVLPPGLEWRTIVSQGCRPIGDPMIVTALDGNRIMGLGGRPALAMLREMFHRLPNHERAMAIEALLIGRAINENSSSFSHGDFLIRNVQGVDEESEAVVVTDRFQVGQTIRFHVRDEQAADSDFATLLERISKREIDCQAAMLFSCNGRGNNMFEQKNHDALAIDKYFPGLPLAGFFAAGEFAPIGNRNLTHGFTAVSAFLCKSSQEL